jgi:hypothetical protein
VVHFNPAAALAKPLLPRMPKPLQVKTFKSLLEGCNVRRTAAPMLVPQTLLLHLLHEPLQVKTFKSLLEAATCALRQTTTLTTRLAGSTTTGSCAC